MNQIIRNLFRLSRAIRGRDIFIFDSINKNKLTIGNDGAAWTIDTKLVRTNPIVYSFGIGTDISFDLGLIKKYNATVYGFDPTPKSIDWVEKQNIHENFQFNKFGVGKNDGLIDFYVPKENNMVSGSIAPNSNFQKIEAEIKKLSTIVETLKHDHIDIIKMDIEGAEYDIIDDMLNLNIPVDQILIEFHHRMPNFSLKDSKEAIKKILKAGYKINNISYLGEEYSFSKI